MRRPESGQERDKRGTTQGTVLVDIGTFEEEDEALDLLTRLTWQLPVFVIVSALLDLVLAVVYLKWLHPWKIILQEVGQK